ncbi:MAG: Uma2 family endonuclease [Chloroflexi bacterium]|nr:Uma2 family endonuclease [Chloroflexota bacterium]
MATSLRFTSADLEVMPDDGKRYEVIDGDLYVSKQPSWHHQRTCGRVFALLESWNSQAGLGEANLAPGVIFAEDDDVVPDVVWVGKDRLPLVLGDDGKLHDAPDLVVEVLSPGRHNEQRDRDAKLKLYSRRGVREYWILDRQLRTLEIYRRHEAALRLEATLYEDDVLSSPLLSGFSCQVGQFFA